MLQPIDRGMTRRPSIYKQSIGNTPHTIHNKYVAGSGIGATNISVRRHRNIYAHPTTTSYRPVAPPTGDQVGAIWPKLGGYGGKNNRQSASSILDINAIHSDWENKTLNGNNIDFFLHSCAPVIDVNGILYSVIINAIEGSIEEEMSQTLYNSYLIAYSPDDGELLTYVNNQPYLFQYDLEKDGFAILSVSPLIGSGGILYLATEYSIVAISSATATMLWRFTDNGNTFQNITFACNNILAVQPQSLLLIDSLGTLLWRYQTVDGIPPHIVPVVDQQQNIYIVYGSTAGYFERITSQGKLYGNRVETTYPFVSSPVLSSDESWVVTGFNDEYGNSFLQAYNTSTGQSKWPYMSGPVQEGYTFIVNNSPFSTNQPTSLVMDENDIIYAQMVLVTGENAQLSAWSLYDFNIYSPTLVWGCDLNGLINCSMPIIDGTGNLIFSANDGFSGSQPEYVTSYILSVNNEGDINWVYPMNDLSVNVIMYPVTIANNFVYSPLFTFTNGVGDVRATMVAITTNPDISGIAL